MPRLALVAVSGLLLALLLYLGAAAQPPVPRVRLQGAHTSIADVDHAGALYVTTLSPQAVSQSGAWTTQHISSVLHVAIVQGAGAGAQHLLVAPVYQGGAWNVSAAQSGSWTIQAAHLAGVPSVSQGSGWAVAAHAQQSGSWTIQAAHQGGEWNVRHVGSVVHVAIVQGVSGGASHLLVAPVYQAGAWTVSAAQSGVLTVQAAHQGGQWNMAHVTSVSHVRGTMQLAATYGQVAFLTHFGALAVTCYTNAGVAESCGGSGGGDAVNVFHQSTVRHVSSVTHVAIVQGAAGGASHLLVAPVYQAGTWTVQPGNTPNTSAWLANVAHISTVLHVAVVSGGVGIGKTLTYVSVNQGGAGTTTLASAAVGLNHKILGAVLTLSVLGTLKFTDGVADLTGPMDVAATGGFVLPTASIPYQQTAATNRALNLVTTLGAARGVVVILTEP